MATANARWVVFVAALLLAGGVNVGAAEKEDRFIGWKGATYKPVDVWGNDNDGAEGAGGNSVLDVPHGWVEHISWHPRAFVYHNFLTNEECDHLINASIPQMKRSKVVGKNGESETMDVRTSYGSFLRRFQDPVIESVQQRVAHWTHLPLANQEDTQVLRYVDGQNYKAHYDSSDTFDSPRLATVLLYLSDVEEGGETAFPLGSEWVNPIIAERSGPFSDCAKGHVAMKPHKGDALLFFSATPAGDKDPASLHTGCPTIRGVKWTATVWIRASPYRPESFHRPKPTDMPRDPGYCKDVNENCAMWAARGECESNAKFMTGLPDSVGACRLSCKACEQCSEGDRACYNRNREAAGYLVLEE